MHVKVGYIERLTEESTLSRGKMKTKLSESESQQELGWLLTDSIYDLCAPVEVFRNYLKVYESADSNTDNSQHMFDAVVRLCRHSVVMAICKLEDALVHHGRAYKDAPEEIMRRVKSFRKHFEDKKYRTLRSKFIAHNFDSYETHTYQDGERIASGIYGSTISDLKSYFDWIKPPEDCLELREESPAWIACDLKKHIQSRIDLIPRVPLH